MNTNARIKGYRIPIAGAAVLALAGLAACGGSGGGDDDDIGTINFYSPETADMTEEIARAFEDQVGGTVNVTYGGTGDIVNRIQAEKSNPKGDVWYGGGGWIPFEFAKAEGFLAPYEPETAKDWEMFEGPIQMHDEEWYWVGADVFTLGIAYDSEEWSEDELPQTWEELADPKWAGQFQLPNPAASGTATLFVLSQMLEMGEDEAWEYFDQIVENAQAIPDSGAGPTQAVAQGEAALGVAFEFMPYQLQEQQGATTEFFIPETAPVLVNPITLIADGPNPEGAKKFIDWFLSPEGAQVRADWQYLPTTSEGVDIEIPLTVEEITDHAMDLDLEWTSEKYESARSEWNDRYAN